MDHRAHDRDEHKLKNSTVKIRASTKCQMPVIGTGAAVGWSRNRAECHNSRSCMSINEVKVNLQKLQVNELHASVRKHAYVLISGEKQARSQEFGKAKCW